MDYLSMLAAAFRAGSRDAHDGKPLGAWPDVGAVATLAEGEPDAQRDVFLAWRAGWYAYRKMQPQNEGR